MKAVMENSIRRKGGRSRCSEEGLSLVEVAASLSIFLIMIVCVFSTMLHGIEHRRQSLETYRALSALRDMAASIQETANQPQDLAKGAGIGAIYMKYNGKTFPVTGLSSGQITVSCFADENTVPAALGGPQDLNFDGDALDALNNVSAGTDLKLVPLTLTVTYLVDNVTRTLTLDRLITKTAD